MSEYITDVLYNPSAANRITKSILKACSSLKQQPMMGISVKEKTGYNTDLRYLVREKHLIFYKTEDEDIFVARIINVLMDYINVLFGE